MEVIEKMSNTQYEAICDAGVELVRELTAVLKRFGLDRDQAFNVLVVAASGITAVSELSSVELADAVDTVIPMWRVQDVDGDRQAIFDPTAMKCEPTVDPLASN